MLPIFKMAHSLASAYICILNITISINYYITSIYYFMWRDLIERFSGYTPIKSFFNYIFKRISNDFLQNEPKIDFKSGVLDLLNLPLSTEKINNSFLTTSPYILHHGVINHLKITLPSLKEIASKSIEIEVTGVHLIFKPNKEFEQKFNEKLIEIKQRNKFYDDEVPVEEKYQADQDNSIDFFKQILKQILTNIKINIKDICIQVFMNTPSQIKEQKKPQFFSMLRIPTITFQRYTDKEIGKSTEQFEKYKLEIPQISSHLLREDMNFPEYKNIKSEKQDFPFRYPPTGHPSTVLLIGLSNINQESSGKRITVIIKISKDVKHRIKQTKITAEIPNIQLMVEGQQIRVFEKFIKQLQQFKKIYECALETLKEDDNQLYQKLVPDQSKDFDLNSKLRNSTSTFDIFSSMAIDYEGIERNDKKKGKGAPGYFQSMVLEDKQFSKEVSQFNKEMPSQIKKKISEENKIEYKDVLKLKAEILIVYAYVLKYNSNSQKEYQRVWAQFNGKKYCHNKEYMPCSYFFLKIRQVIFDMENKSNMSAQIKKLKLLNVKLIEPAQQIFIDQKQSFKTLDNASSIFQSFVYDSEVQEEMFKPKNQINGSVWKQLVKFNKSHDSHYCINELLSINTKYDRPFKKHKCGFKYNFVSIPEKQVENMLDFSIVLKLNIEKQKGLISAQVYLKKLSIVMDLQIIKDFVDITHPLFIYKWLVENINLKREQIAIIEKKTTTTKINSLYHSNYKMANRLEQTKQEENSKDSKRRQKNQNIIVEAETIRCIFKESPSELKQDLIAKEKNKIQDKDSFVATCYCNHKGKALGLQVKGIKFQKTGRFKFFIKSLNIGIHSIINEEKRTFESIIKIENQIKEQTKIYFQKSNQCQENKNIELNIFVPVIKVEIDDKQFVQIISFASQQMVKAKQVFEYFKYLEYEMRKLTEVEAFEKKSKKNIDLKSEMRLILHVENINIRLLNFGICLKDLMIFSIPDKNKIKIDDLIIFNYEQRQVKIKKNQKGTDEQNNYTLRQTNIERFKCGIKKILQQNVILFASNIKQKNINKALLANADKKYFLSLVVDKQVSTISISIEKKSEIKNENPQKNGVKSTLGSAPVFFKKAPRELKRLSIIDEQNDQKIFNASIINSITIRLCELSEIIKIKTVFQELKNVFEKSQIKQIFSSHEKVRKNSQQAPVNKINLQVMIEHINIDIFPYFKNQGDFKILSNTRSFLCIDQICLVVNQTSGLHEKEFMKKTQVSFKIMEIDYFFLTFNDCVIDFNPLILYREELIEYGFKKILSIGYIDGTMRIFQNTHNKKTFKLQLRNNFINYESAVKTIKYLIQHLKWVELNFKEKSEKIVEEPLAIKKAEQKKRVNSEESDDQFIIIDNSAEINYKKNDELRLKEQRQFRQISIQAPLKDRVGKNLFLQIQIQEIEIKRISIVLNSGEDFDFFNRTEKSVYQPSVIQLNENYEQISQQKYDNTQKTLIKQQFVRLRRKQVSRYNNVTIGLESLKFNCLKHQNIDNTKEMNLLMKIDIKSISAILNKFEQDPFCILRSNITQRLTFYLDIADLKIKFKMQFYRLDVGYSSYLNFVNSEMKEAENQLKNSYFYMEPQQKPRNPEGNEEKIYELFLIVPECTLKLNLKLNVKDIGWKIFTNQQIKIFEFFFHNQLSPYLKSVNEDCVKTWLKEILKGNIGSILGSSFIALFLKSIEGLLALLKGIIFLPNRLLML